MHVVVATHGHCFDGLASAALFTWLLRELSAEVPSFSYLACGYGIGQRSASADLLLGDENAILDYRYTPSDKVSWYFDHHRTAFAQPEDRAFFDRHGRPDRHFFDPSYSSCTKLIRDIAKERFQLENPHLDELVAWADLIDAAAFKDAQQACDTTAPLLQLVSVVEHHGHDAFLKRFVPQLLSQPLLEVASSSEVAERFRPIGERQARFTNAVRERAVERGRVVHVDLTDRPLDVLGKFITYALFPNSVYSVIAVRLKRGYKLSVGYNPWCGQPLDADISAICARHGGGGHRAVGGISLPDDRGDEARALAYQIARELGADS